MSFSVGVLYSAQEFLVLASSYQIRSEEFLKDDRYSLARTEAILEVLQECSWVRLNGDGLILVTEKGVRIAARPSSAGRLRLQIEDLITVRQPPWAAKIMHGRKETTPAMPSDVEQCFKESGLLGPWDEELREWWATAAFLARSRHNERLSVTGRRAETLSCGYEMDRTGSTPEWVSLDSSFAGYDVLSCRSTVDPTPLRIEVKGSERPPSRSDFSISRHESDTAKTTIDYVLHLWFVSENPQLFVVPFLEVEPHLPIDCEKGRWQQARIPFASFKAFRQL